ncbi:hypothetical protein [Dyadobacter luticola]|uniref:Uncharacterized protein n=1 Tax=Dyadobacter luticola TaxID=1979387 RepID=A0A5R9L4E0_9BACT|nr:hypothetical protein [Dyadobacter luticola]TLV03454.1 hypothetical protein FEN17_07565 [Dyadobacter luticola]
MGFSAFYDEISLPGLSGPGSSQTDTTHARSNNRPACDCVRHLDKPGFWNKLHFAAPALESETLGVMADFRHFRSWGNFDFSIISDEEPEFQNYSPFKFGGSPVRMVLQTSTPEIFFDSAVKLGATQICPVTVEES